LCGGLIGIPLFKKLINAIKTGDMETIKQEIAEHISYFRLYLDNFLQLFRFFGFLEKKALF
jgi:hypothetical protein